MKQITETSFQQGYFKIPRTLLKQQTGSGQLENMGAFFQVLSHANYSETTYNIHGLTIFCQRGESLISNLHWSILFGWTRYKTARFFKRLEREGIIEILPHPEKNFPYPHHQLRPMDWKCTACRLLSERGRIIQSFPHLLGQLPSDHAEAQSQRRPCPPRMGEAHERRMATCHRPYRRCLLPHQRHPLHRPRLHLPERQSFPERIHRLTPTPQTS